MTLKAILKKFHPDFNGGQVNRVDELQNALAARRRQCACGCGRRLLENQVRKGCHYATQHCGRLARIPHLSAALTACLVLLLTGCAHSSHIMWPDPPPFPPGYTSQKANTETLPLPQTLDGRQMMVDGGNQTAADTLAIIAPPPPVVFKIKYAANDANNYGADLVFDIYATPDLALPATVWALVATLPGTATELTVPNEGAQMFFTAVARSLVTGLQSQNALVDSAKLIVDSSLRTDTAPASPYQLSTQNPINFIPQ